jgi:hypothetical protein
MAKKYQATFSSQYLVENDILQKLKKFFPGQSFKIKVFQAFCWPSEATMASPIANNQLQAPLGSLFCLTASSVD